MQRTWNYIFYSTWKLHNRASDILTAPILYLVTKVPLFRENWKKGEKEYNKFIKSRNLGFNVSLSFSWMLTTTSILYSILFLYVCYFFQIEVGENVHYYFIAVVALSILTNELLLWRNDIYLKYFDEFDRTNKKSLTYLPAVLFHLGVIVFAVLSIYWTVGFSL